MSLIHCSLFFLYMLAKYAIYMPSDEYIIKFHSTYQYLAPSTPHSRYSVYAFDWCPTPCASSSAISLDPMMPGTSAPSASTSAPHTSVGLYAIRWSTLDTPFMYRIFAKYTAQALFSKADKTVQAEVAISRSVEVLQSPRVLSVSCHARIQT